ncbi:MAG: zinc-binding dehydrogenase [Actinomycetota bacterium]|jgi:NADPH:quinone reductase-like Zn-dependent oxidoreductase
MHAVVISESTLTLSERDTATPQSGDVIVAMAGAGLNAADLLQRAGFYPAPAGWPADIPGLEVSGTVVALGDQVTSVALGDRVCSIVGGGGQSSHVAVPSEHLIAVPPNVDLASAGGFAEAFCTAYDALVVQANIQAGEHLVVSGAAGGVGSAAIQIAASRGARVTAVTRDDRHHRALSDLGATKTVLNEAGQISDPVDVILELVGAAHLAHAQYTLAPRARVVVIGVGGGSRIELDLLNVMSKRISVTGSTLRARSRVEKAELVTGVTRDLSELWANGHVHVPVAGYFPLTAVHEAYEAFATPGKFGKIILTP